MTRKPDISPSDFAFHAKVRIKPGKDWSKQLIEALQSQLQVKGQIAGTHGYFDAPREPGIYEAGLNVIAIRKKKSCDMPLHELELNYAAFDASGKPVSWSSDFDRDFPTKTRMFWMSADNRWVVFTDEQRKRAKALAPPGATQPADKRGSGQTRSAKRKPTPPAGPRHDALVAAISFSPDGATLFTTGADGSLRSWDATSGKRKASHRLGSRLHHFAVDPTADRVVAAAAKLIVLDPDTGDRLQTLRGHGMDDAMSIVFLASDRIVSTSHKDLVTWDARSGERLARVMLPDHERFLAGAPDGARIALAYDNRLEIRDTHDLALLRELARENERLGHIVVWSDAGIWLQRARIRHCTVGIDEREEVPAIQVLATTVDLLDPSTLEVLRSIDHGVDAISSDGRHALVVDGAKARVLSLLDDGAPIELELPQAPDLYACAVAPGGRRIAVGDGPEIVLLDVAVR